MPHYGFRVARRVGVLLAGGACIVAALVPAGALGFGTANGIKGMAFEHEAITRAALSCAPSSTQKDELGQPTGLGVADPVPNCFGPRSIDNLAGWGSFVRGKWASRCGQYYCTSAVSGGFGAVGAADNLAMRVGLPMPGGPDWWHCDGGDYIDGGSRTVAQSRAALAGCQNFAQEMLMDGITGGRYEFCRTGGTFNFVAPCFGAVKAARYLLDTSNKVNTKMDLRTDCNFAGGDWTSRPWAKCTVLEPFGYALHTVMDFYSHTNYVDTAGPGPIGVSNPPGLQNTTLPSFWNQSVNVTNLNDDALFPAQPNGVWPISGCFNGITSADGGECKGRVTHTTLTKDLSGGINWQLGSGATITTAGNPRGKIAQNGQQAVTLSILEVRRQWQRLQDAIIARYGTLRGNRMICAIIKDDPAKECNG